MTTTGFAVPGRPAELAELAAACRRTAGALRDDAERLRAADVTSWSGPAARAFATSVSGLPRQLTGAAFSYDSVAAALARYAEELRRTQQQAHRAAGELADLEGLLVAEGLWALGGFDAASAAARERRVAAYEEEQASVRRRLTAAVEGAQCAAGEAACRVRSACNPPPPPPGVMSRLADGVGDWVEAHADVLGEISGALKGVSAVAGLLALVPALAPVAVPVAVTAGLAAVAIDVALARRERASWAVVGVDAALTAIPAARPARAAVREVRTRLGSVVVYRVEGTPNARISIDAQNNVTFSRRSMLYLNVGERARAEEFYRRKVADGLPGVQLKSFRVPKQAYRELSLRAVDQELAKAFRGRPHRVDVAVARNQFGLWRADFRELQHHILPGSGRILR